MKNKKNGSLEKTVFFLSAGCITIIIGLLFLFPDESKIVVDRLMFIFTHKLGALYILIYVVLVVFLIYLTFSRHGKVVLGTPGEKPEYDNFSWMAMMFCTGIASSLMIFSFIEPIYYLTDTPFGIEPMSIEAYEYAHMYGQFHWGPSAWLFYTPATIAIAYNLFVRKGTSVRLGELCRVSRLGNHRVVSSAIDVFTIFAVLGGIGTSMGLAAPLVCQIISRTFRIPNDERLLGGVFILWFAVFATSVWR